MIVFSGIFHGGFLLCYFLVLVYKEISPIKRTIKEWGKTLKVLAIYGMISKNFPEVEYGEFRYFSPAGGGFGF